jgi:hypothetical protein
MRKPIRKPVSPAADSNTQPAYTSMADRRKAHQCAAASYYAGPFGQEPMLVCTCGKSFPQDTWEEAGRLFDAHLAMTKKKRKP